ncbi:plastocyanin/azurin family copper-binding protein [Nitrososphaera sp.]|uniref:cupredoxin domain-containing protein n=1 Tax=Nitrososphaera sp. TaxID=1971748 RepID=UPI00317BCFD3
MKWWAVAAIAASALAAAVVVATLYMPAPVVTVEIVNEGTTPDSARFEPGAIAVQRHTTIIWKNTDASAHTVTSRSPSAAFDSGVMGPGGEFEFTFEEKREYEYYCKIHPVMVGSVQVQ